MKVLGINIHMNKCNIVGANCEKTTNKYQQDISFKKEIHDEVTEVISENFLK